MMARANDNSLSLTLELPDWMAELVVQPAARERAARLGIRVLR